MSDAGKNRMMISSFNAESTVPTAESAEWDLMKVIIVLSRFAEVGSRRRSTPEEFYLTKRQEETCLRLAGLMLNLPRSGFRRSSKQCKPASTH